jgi:hypothetical protein
MFDDSFASMEIGFKILFSTFISVVRDDLEYDKWRFIVMCDFCESGSFHINELSSFCLKQFFYIS